MSAATEERKAQRRQADKARKEAHRIKRMSK
jgi:hypothetical protein